MKNFMSKLLITWLIVIFPLTAFGQQPPLNVQYTFTSATAGAARDISNLGLSWIKITWDVRDGTLSACTFTVQGSIDGVNFTDINNSTTCTTDGMTNVFPIGASSSFVRINVSAFTINGGSSKTRVTFNIVGWVEIQSAPGYQIQIQPQTTSGIAATTLTRNTVNGMSVFQNCYVLVAVTTTGTATATANLYIEDSVDNGTTWDDLISSLAITFGGATSNQRFTLSGTTTGATITTAASTNITQGSNTAVETLAAGSARQGPWGDRWRVREKVASPSGSPVGIGYNINAVCKR